MSKAKARLVRLGMVCLVTAAMAAEAAESAPDRLGRSPARPVRVVGNSLVDDNGPFLGLGVSYFTALWRCKFDQLTLERDLAFLASQGFNYYRMLSMVGFYPAWEGLEICPVGFQNRAGKRVDAWPDYWAQLARLVDLAYDKHSLRTQITIFADAQLMPQREGRLAHMRSLLERVVKGREHKILLLEVANEAWQNGFPGRKGTSDLREFAAFLGARTEVPIAITSNHETPEAYEELYSGGKADLATWHFSRDRGPGAGWAPVYDCWDFAKRPGLPPVISNEPIGPGSSVNSEREPIRLVMAAAFAYSAGVPAYVFHSEAGVFGKTSFQATPAIDQYKTVLKLLPPDLPGWQRNDGKEPSAPFTVYAGGKANMYWPEGGTAKDGCVRNTGSRKDDRFICVPIGIRSGGLELESRNALRFAAHDPLTGKTLKSGVLRAKERVTMPAGPGGLLILGNMLR